jgi:hypothetical protein
MAAVVTKVCTCGKPATHRVRWNWLVKRVQPHPSVRPARCLECAIQESERATVLHREREQRERDFIGHERHVFWTVQAVPHDWYVRAKQVVRRYGDSINPGGLIEVFQKERHIQVEVCPPWENKPSTWDPEHVLYMIRYLSRMPLQFARRPDDESLSPRMWAASRKQWADTQGPVLLSTLPTPTDASGE